MVKPTRLTRNRHGTYCLRWIVPADLRPSCQGRREVRFSLRTTDSSRARILALEFNLALERIKQMTRSKTPPIDMARMMLTMGGLSVDIRDDNDRRLFDAFLRENPDIRQQMLLSIRSGQPPAEALAALIEHTKAASDASNGVAKPTLLADAIKEFVGTRAGLARNSRSTMGEKDRTLSLFQEHIESSRPGTKVFVHDVRRSDAVAFVNAYAARPGKGTSKASDPGSGDEAPAPSTPASSTKTSDALASRTVIKAVGHLREFFDYAAAAEMLKTNPLDGAFDRAIEQVRKGASAAKRENSYDLMNESDIRRIFAPRTYLTHMNAADDFWAPLIGLYTGARLGEIVTLPADGIRVDKASGVYVMHIDDSKEDGRRTKNRNSVRLVPVPDVLVTLGLIEYVQHVQSLGARTLFPHRPLNPTRIADPSKHVSRVFGQYLDVLGITDRNKTFHSFRHTVITLMHVRNVPLAEAVLIVGHAAQDQIIRQQSVSAFNQYGSSTHLNTYVHAGDFEQPDMPLCARLKVHMDQALRYPLDIAGLRAAAAIVKDTTVCDKSKRFKSGWHTNSKKVAEQMLARLDAAIATVPAVQPAPTGASS